MKQCVNCGNQNDINAAVCSYCGTSFQAPPGAQQFAPQQNTPPQQYTAQQYPPQQYPPQQYPPQAPRGTHDYHKLGGWLMFIVIASIIGALYSAYGLIGSVNDLGELRELNQFFGIDAPIGALTFALVLSVVSLVASVVFVIFLVQRNPNCVLIYHISVATDLIAAVIVIISFGSFFNSLGPIMPASEITEFYATAIGAIVGAVIALIIWTVYFTKSVRMRTYMGSDEYLRKSPLTKSARSPIPADGSMNTPQM